MFFSLPDKNNDAEGYRNCFSCVRNRICIKLALLLAAECAAPTSEVPISCHSTFNVNVSSLLSQSNNVLLSKKGFTLPADALPSLCLLQPPLESIHRPMFARKFEESIVLSHIEKAWDYCKIELFTAYLAKRKWTNIVSEEMLLSAVSACCPLPPLCKL